MSKGTLRGHFFGRENDNGGVTREIARVEREDLRNAMDIHGRDKAGVVAGSPFCLIASDKLFPLRINRRRVWY